MALDLYAGGLVRYLSGDWSNEAQAQSEREGVAYKQITLDGTIDITRPSSIVGWFRRRRIAPKVRVWQEHLAASIGRPIELSEGKSTPWISRRLQWFAFDALKMWASYLTRDRKAPTELPDDFFSDPLYAADAQGGINAQLSVLYQPTLWLPVEIDRPLQIPWVDEKREVTAHSSLLLSSTLSALQKRLPPLESRTENETGIAQALARVRESATFSARHHVVMLLDF